MSFTTERTRFLPYLDKMTQQDRQGAIADMLQILREQGIVKTANARLPGRSFFSQDDEYVDAIRRQAAMAIGNLVTNDQVMEKRPTADPLQDEYAISVEMVVLEKA